MKIKVIDAAKAHQGKIVNLGWDFEIDADGVFVGQKPVEFNGGQYYPTLTETPEGVFAVMQGAKSCIKLPKVEIL